MDVDDIMGAIELKQKCLCQL